MTGEAQHGGVVVDPDPVHALDARGLVADDRRHGPFQHGEEVRIVFADGVDDEAVDTRTVHRGDVGVLGAHRDEQQSLARRSHARASPSRKPVATGSRKAYDRASVSSSPTAPARRVRSERATGSGPG